MCGINGIIGTRTVDRLSDRINRMNSSIEHRGKDADGVFIAPNIALGHRRLSIIDLNPTGNQPMQSGSGNWTIVFNGEIYNHSQIRNEIRNYEFKGESDTEVIVASFENYGIDWFLERANGMFAIGAYNHITEELFLIRDRLGIKPLFFYSEQDLIVFSSEVKGILSSGLVKAEFNDSAIDDYLAYRYVREPNTFFSNIYQVESGHYLVIKSGDIISKMAYWDVPMDWNVNSNYREEEIETQFEEHLLNAVKRRMISDVPLGCYLSGGVDSSLLTAIVSKNSEGQINTYTIGFDELNEFEYSRIISDQYQTIHHEIEIKDEVYFSMWDELIKFKDAPLAVPNEIPLSIMSTRLKSEISVVLSGEGADELLGGYGRIFRSFFDFNNHPNSESFYSYFIEKYEYVSRDFRNEFLINSEGYRNEFDLALSSAFNEGNGDQAIFRFFHKYHVKGLLQRVDMSTMQATVEARVPFLDHELIEYVYSNVPYQLKLKWRDNEAKKTAKVSQAVSYSEILDTPKYLLKKIAYNHLDKRIIERKKVGFPVPLDNWLHRLGALARESLTDAPWLHKSRVSELIERSKTHVRSAQILWMFINVEKFRKLYFLKDWRW